MAERETWVCAVVLVSGAVACGDTQQILCDSPGHACAAASMKRTAPTGTKLTPVGC